MGVNLAGVELILRLLEDMDEMRRDLEHQFEEYAKDVEARLQQILEKPHIPLRKDETLLPVPNIRPTRQIDI
jgi:MerR family transcriptional regulator/heat shock protein HspR